MVCWLTRFSRLPPTPSHHQKKVFYDAQFSLILLVLWCPHNLGCFYDRCWRVREDADGTCCNFLRVTTRSNQRCCGRMPEVLEVAFAWLHHYTGWMKWKVDRFEIAACGSFRTLVKFSEFSHLSTHLHHWLWKCRKKFHAMEAHTSAFNLHG